MSAFADFCHSPFQYKRRNSLEVTAGNLIIGGNKPVRLQSMTNTITRKTEETVEQCIRIYEAGGEMVRITTPTLSDVEYVARIKNELRKRGYSFPLVTDVHFSPAVAEAAASIVEKVRINPGNFSESKFDVSLAHDESEWQKHLSGLKEKFIRLLNICKENNTALRIGVNHGSLSSRIMSRYGDTPQGMTESAMEFLRICREENFDQVIISMKASNVQVMVEAYRMLVASMNSEKMYFPLHLGVTEAGEGEDGRIKSAVGIGALLADGIGDTIRVSLTEDPEKEIPVARKIVSYFQGREKITGFSETPDLPDINPFEYSRRKSAGIYNIGGASVPVVIGLANGTNSVQLQQWGWNSFKGKFTFEDQSADYLFADKVPQERFSSGNHAFIVPFHEWEKEKDKTNIIPFITVSQADSVPKGTPVFIKADYQTLPGITSRIPENSILIIESLSGNAVAEWRACFSLLKKADLNNPVILYKKFPESPGEDLQLKAACDFGALLIDGLGDGIWIEGPDTSSRLINSTAFGILQATRTRISKTEYISCPSCGRTLFDLQTTSARIRERTKHLKGLKIGIMGCIVNGPGEMADADYGYVGAGPGRITLYKKKEVIKKNIPENEAVEELISLIKANGDWQEPE